VLGLAKVVPVQMVIVALLRYIQLSVFCSALIII